jgi:hypothetical protein
MNKKCKTKRRIHKLKKEITFSILHPSFSTFIKSMIVCAIISTFIYMIIATTHALIVQQHVKMIFDRIMTIAEVLGTIVVYHFTKNIRPSFSNDRDRDKHTGHHHDHRICPTCHRELDSQEE